MSIFLNVKISVSHDVTALFTCLLHEGKLGGRATAFPEHNIIPYSSILQGGLGQ